jgi:hypothetical protein
MSDSRIPRISTEGSRSLVAVGIIQPVVGGEIHLENLGTAMDADELERNLLKRLMPLPTDNGIEMWTEAVHRGTGPESDYVGVAIVGLPPRKRERGPDFKETESQLRLWIADLTQARAEPVFSM